MNGYIFLYWLLEDLILLLFFIWQRKAVFDQPIKGGNGVTQSNELAQVVLIYSLMWIIRAYLRGLGQVPESVTIAMILAVAALAGIKRGVFDNLRNKPKE